MLPAEFNSMFAPINSLANISDDARNLFNASFGEAFSGMTGGGVRRIRVAKTNFELIDGNNVTPVPSDGLIGVLVGASRGNYATWYARSYAPGQEPAAPDLVWEIDPACTVFPDALPAQYREKVNINGKLRWAFQIRKRLAFALLRNIDGQPVLDTDHPYMLDITSMSMYGDGVPAQNMYRWAGLRSVCQQASTSGITVTPNMFLTQIVLDPTVSVAGVVMFRPCMQNGQLGILAPDMLKKVYDCMLSEGTKELVTIHEKLTLDDAQPTATADTLQQPQIVTVPPVTQPAPAPAPEQPKPAPVQPAPQTEIGMASLLAQAEAAMHGTPAPAQPATTPAADATENNVQALLDQLSIS